MVEILSNVREHHKKKIELIDEIVMGCGV
jgi:hypothetical protein